MHHPLVAKELARALARPVAAPLEPRQPECPVPEGRPPGPRASGRALDARTRLMRRHATPVTGSG
jgi:hypothetical protein